VTAEPEAAPKRSRKKTEVVMDAPADTADAAEEPTAEAVPAEAAAETTDESAAAPKRSRRRAAPKATEE
jgi:hypothetical protein